MELGSALMIRLMNGNSITTGTTKISCVSETRGLNESSQSGIHTQPCNRAQTIHFIKQRMAFLPRGNESVCGTEEIITDNIPLYILPEVSLFKNRHIIDQDA